MGGVAKVLGVVCILVGGVSAAAVVWLAWTGRNTPAPAVDRSGALVWFVTSLVGSLVLATIGAAAYCVGGMAERQKAAWRVPVQPRYEPPPVPAGSVYGSPVPGVLPFGGQRG